jgi:hypothetical protein
MFKLSAPRHQGYLTTIEKDLNIKGIWWIPSNPEDEISGTVSLKDGGGIILDMIGTFGKEKDSFTKLNNFDLIRGYSRSGGELTLHNCREIIKKTPFGSGTEHSYISCETAYFNLDLDEEEEIKFDIYYLDFPFLEEWLCLFGFEADWNNLDDWKLTFKKPETYIAENEYGSFKIDTKLVAGHKNQFKYTAEQKSWFKFTLSEKTTFDDFKDKFLIPSQNFISFVTNYPNWIKFISARSSDDDKNKSDIKIHHLQPFKKDDHNKSPSRQDQLFSLKNVDKEFSFIFNNWLNIHDDLEAVIELYFGVLFNKHSFPKTRFLNLCQACESYHSIRKESSIVKEKTHRKRLKSVLGSISEEYKTWVNDGLYHANRKTLKTQLTELLEEFLNLYSPFIQSNEKLAKKIKDTRNYYTHYNSALKDKAAKGKELILLSELLSTLIKTHLLSELGFSKVEIEKIMNDLTQFEILRDTLKKVDYSYTYSA